jgi:membrane protein implicated in regulation of membrane protease activity
MSTKFNFKLLALCTILSAMLVVPALGQGKDETGELQKSGEKKTEGQVQLQKKEERRGRN